MDRLSPPTLIAAALVSTLLVAAPAPAQDDGAARPDEVARHDDAAPRALERYNLGDEALALGGYDPVAYFPEGGGEPREGDARHAHRHDGVLYHFASAENLQRFRAAPGRFEPAYGGWCAWAMSQDYEAPANPKAFRIHRGRLFVFYKNLLTDTRDDWIGSGDENRLMGAADGNWERRTGEKPPRLSRDTSLLNLERSGLALGGFDPVAYFPEGGGRAARGHERLSTVHEGVRYRFASEANRDAFVADPARFEPAYGGWCAYAVAVDGSFVEVDPESFLIQDGRLHVFYDGFLADTRSKWSEDPGGFDRKARGMWKKITEKGGAL